MTTDDGSSSSPLSSPDSSPGPELSELLEGSEKGSSYATVSEPSRETVEAAAENLLMLTFANEVRRVCLSETVCRFANRSYRDEDRLRTGVDLRGG
jgi:hypothetical protein